MKYSVELLRSDVEEELIKIKQLEKEFAAAEERVDLWGESVSNYDRGAIGYQLHNFYNGCENIFRSIARFFENDVEPQTWHRDLLRRMKLDVPGFRPRVIDESLYRLLDDFRGFRHKFRHSYAFELDWEREQLVARKFRAASAALDAQVRDFLRKLDELERES